MTARTSRAAWASASARNCTCRFTCTSSPPPHRIGATSPTSVKAVGWVIPEFGCAQVSINLTDLDITPLHVAFDTCDERARDRGLRVTGSEIVGLVPRQVLLDAGRHYLQRMGRPTGIAEAAIL